MGQGPMAQEGKRALVLRSEVWGSEFGLVPSPETGRSASSRLRFRFVSCVRAGEANLRGRVRDVILNAGPPGSQDRLVSSRSGLIFYQLLLTGVRVLMVFGLKVLARGVDIVDRRAGFKVFGVCNDANPLCFVRVPRF